MEVKGSGPGGLIMPEDLAGGDEEMVRRGRVPPLSERLMSYSNDGLFTGRKVVGEEELKREGWDRILDDVDWSQRLKHIPAGYDKTVGLKEFADRLEASAGLVHEMIESRRIIVDGSGFRLLWEKQIAGRRRLVRGLQEVHEEIWRPEWCWAFLTQEWLFEDEVARPLEIMKAGKVTKVIEAARVFSRELAEFMKVQQRNTVSDSVF